MSHNMPEQSFEPVAEPTFEEVAGYDPRRFVHYNPIEVGYLLSRLVDSMWADHVDCENYVRADFGQDGEDPNYASLKGKPIDQDVKDKIVDDLFMYAHELVCGAVGDAADRRRLLNSLGLSD